MAVPSKVPFYFVAFFGFLLLFTATVKCKEEGETPAADSEDILLQDAIVLDENGADDDDDESSKAEERDGVLVLNGNNFDNVVMDKDIILVEFYAPWCGHCKSLAPEYAKAAKKLKKADPPVPLAMVDADSEKGLAQRFEVQGFPTLKIFRKGEMSDYDGPREEKGIVEYMKEQSDPNWKPPPENVKTLTSENFDETINNAELILVEFYAPWCGHCKKMAPELEYAAEVLQMAEPPIPIGKVDATAESELGSRFGVTGYPTLFIFRKGVKYEYKGPRERHGIRTYMVEQAGDSSQHLSSPKEIKHFLDNIDDVGILGFFKSDEEQMFKTYLDAGNDLRDDYNFGHTFDSHLMDVYKVNPNSIVVFFAERFHSKYEPKRQVFDKEDATAAEIQVFYSDHNVPLVGHMTKDNMEKRYKGRPLLVVYYDVNWEFEGRKATQIWRQKVLDVAKDKKYKDVTFAIADEGEMKDQVKELGLDDSGEEINVGLFAADRLKYRMEPEEDFDSDTLREFLDAWRKGKIDSVVKSQPIPKKQSGPVTVVVGKTFEKIVMDTKKDVMIELYAPWCGHCKKLEPMYKKLAKKYKDKPSIVIAKMDATANDTPSSYSAGGFPTIYFAKADDKKNPLKFEGGDRSVESLSKFIDENVSKAAKEEL